MITFLTAVQNGKNSRKIIYLDTKMEGADG